MTSIFSFWNLLFKFGIRLLVANCWGWFQLPLRMLTPSVRGVAWSSDAWMFGSFNCNSHPWLLEVWRFNRTFLIFLGDASCKQTALASFPTTPTPWNHKGREVTALVQASLEEFFLLFATASGFRWLLDCASRFVIRTSGMQSVWRFQIFLISRPPRSSVGVDIPLVSSTSALRPG